MTPEERDLVRGLFDRLAGLEREPRDPEADQLIREGIARVPNAAYSLVQTVLIQDGALRAASDRIEQLERQLADAQRGAGSASGAGQGGSFLGSQRNKWNTGAVLGAPEPQPGYPQSYSGGGGERPGGLPPSFGSGSGSDRPMGLPPGFGGSRGYPGEPYGAAPGGGGSPYGGPAGGAPGGSPYGGPGGPPGGPGGGPAGPGGGSFLGTAAALAAGVIGGGLLMGGLKSALGGQGAGSPSESGGAKSPFADAFEQLTGKSGGSSSGGGDLSRDAGVGDIGKSQPQSAWGQQAENKGQDDNAGYGHDAGFDDDAKYQEAYDSYEDDNDFGDYEDYE